MSRMSDENRELVEGILTALSLGLTLALSDRGGRERAVASVAGQLLKARGVGWLEEAGVTDRIETLSTRITGVAEF